MLKANFRERNYGDLLVVAIAFLSVVALSILQAKHVGGWPDGDQSPSQPRSKQAPMNLVAQDRQSLSSKPKGFLHGVAKIAFERDDCVYLYDVQAKQTHRVSEGYEPDLSPKGDALAFTAERDDSGTNRTIKLFNIQTNTISEFPALGKLNVREPRWSHDATKLAFNVIVGREGHVGILDVSTGQWEDITRGLNFNDPMGLEGPGGVFLNSWSPDDATLLCQDLVNIYEISTSGNVVNRISLETVVPTGEVDSSIRLQFSRDKKLLLFDGARNPEYTAMYLFNLTDQKLRQLTSKRMDGFEPVWLPSENEIMFSRGRDDPSGFASDLCVMSLNTGEVTMILKDASNGSYSTR